MSEQSIEPNKLDIESAFSQHSSISKKRFKKVKQAYSQTVNNFDNDIDKTPATAGVIERIVLHNFMCHEYFELDLGPQLNFIIGRNGSGKSAILTSISVGLGCKANETDRGKSLKNLIKRGSNSSKIAITFANQGDEAFEHEKYGDKIIVERILRLEGTSGYFLKSMKGRTISTKKLDLDLMLEHFDITINNPLAFLSQGAAKTFLSGSTDADKYNFFMKGIQMEQTIEDFMHSNNQMEKINGYIETQSENIKALRDDAKNAKDLYQKFHKFKNLRDSKKVISGKLIWYQIVRGEYDIQTLFSKKMEVEANLQELHSAIDDLNSNLQELADSKASIDLEILDVNKNFEHLKESKSNQRIIVKQFDNKINEIQSKIEDLNKDITKKNTYIRKIDQMVNIEMKKMKNTIDTEKLELELTDLNTKLQEHGPRENVLDSLKGDVKENQKSLYNDFKYEKEEIEKDIYQLRKEMNSIRSTITELKQKTYSKKDKIIRQNESSIDLKNYSPEMRSVYSTIQADRGFKSKPVGPIGAMVSILPEYRNFKPIINILMRKQLEGFVVENFDDMQKLKQIFRKYRVSYPVTVRRVEQFDYSANYSVVKELNLTCVLDALKFKNEHVKFTLIDSLNIECVVLCEDANTDFYQLLMNNRHTIKSLYQLFNHNSGKRLSVNPVTGAFKADPVYYDRVNSFQKIQIANPELKATNNKDLLKLQKERDQEMIRENENELPEIQARLENRNHDLTTLIANYKAESSLYKEKQSEYTKELQELKKQTHKIRSQIHNIEHKLDLNNDNDESTRKIETFKIDKNNVAEEIALIKQSITAFAEESENYKSQFQEVTQTLQDISTQFDVCKSKLGELETRQRNLDTSIDEVNDEIANNNLQIQKRMNIITVIEKNISELTQNIQAEVSKAEKWCSKKQANVDLSKDTKESIKHQYELINQQLSEVNRNLGKSEAQVIKEYNEKTEAFKDAREELVSALAIRDKLVRSLTNRLTATKTNRELLCLAANQDFSSSLNQRGFEGKLNFDFKNKKLQMLVGKDNKPPREVSSLSGGEKSFTQIALLLAIWKPMRSKIRGLDEFDVFMDTVNRRISMRLMLESLRKEPKSQTIFITPQDIGHVKGIDADDVHIHKLKDPARMNNSSNN